MQGPALKLRPNKVRRGISYTFYDTYFRNRFLFPNSGYPSTITGLIGWFRAEQITGLNDNDPIVTWQDESTENNDLTLASLTNKPKWRATLQGGFPSVEFVKASVHGIKTDGVLTGLGGKTGITIAAVVGLSGTTASQIYAALNTTALLFRMAPIGLDYNFHVNAAQASAEVAATGDVDFAYMDFDIDNDTARISLGYGAYQSNTVDPTTFNPGVLSLGALDGGGNPSDCLISELVIYDHRLSDGDASALKDYFMFKYDSILP